MTAQIPEKSAEQVGEMMPHLTGMERELYREGYQAFVRRVSVQGDSYFPNTEIGLGPRFNGDSCGMCHAYPAIGGSSPPRNPQVNVATREGATNVIPSFVRPAGPVLQARFRHADGSSSVSPLFTIAGRPDAPGCQMSQPDFAGELADHRVSFRIPPALFGIGLVEAIPDSEIEANAQNKSSEKRLLGISGHANRINSDGSVGRFGWKAQVSSLQAFVAEAYATEEGVTNELFPQEGALSVAPSCLFNSTPEDRFSPFFSRPEQAISNVARVAYFLEFLAPPATAESSKSMPGKALFTKVGCAECHTPTLITGKSSFPVLSEQTVPLYSDLLVHHMGAGLADGIREGTAGPDEFRTAPLWGVGKRLFFLHDGRTRSLSEAILMHSSRPYHSRRSEADRVITRYRQLTPAEKDDILHFLEAL